LTNSEIIQGSGDNMQSPTIEELIMKLQQVLEGGLSREEVSDWAMKASEVYERESSLSQHEISLWKCLDVVGGIDLKDSPSEYLHNEQDIKGWITKFKQMKDSNQS